MSKKPEVAVFGDRFARVIFDAIAPHDPMKLEKHGFKVRIGPQGRFAALFTRSQVAVFEFENKNHGQPFSFERIIKDQFNHTGAIARDANKGFYSSTNYQEQYLSLEEVRELFLLFGSIGSENECLDENTICFTSIPQEARVKVTIATMDFNKHWEDI